MGIFIKKNTTVLITSFIILLIISLQPFLLVSLEKELAYHMIIEHSIFFLLGAISIKISEIILKRLIIYKRGHRKSSQIQGNKKILFKFTNLWSNIIRHIFKTKRIGYIWVIVSAFILAFWHFPQIFDYSVLNENIHIMQHISFIFVGMTGFLSIRSLGESYQIFLILILSGMMGFIGLIFSVLDDPIYSVYTVAAHNYAGSTMVIVSIILLLIGLPIYAIKKTLIYIKTKT
jgi:hypothetical protein